MKKILLFLLFCLFPFSLIFSQQNVGINKDGSNPDPSAMLDVKSDNQGVLVPRLTSEQRTGINSPANGLLVYDTDTHSFWFYQLDRWAEIGGSGLGNLVLPPPTPNTTIKTSTGPGFPQLDAQGSFVYFTENTTDTIIAPDSLVVLNVSDPFAPQIMGKRKIGSDPTALIVVDERAYLIDDSDNSLRVVDISNPNAPDSIGMIILGNSPSDLAVAGNHAFITDIQDDFLRIVDMSDPANLIQVGSLGIGPIPLALDVQDDYLFIIDGQDVNLRVIDISDPSQPNQVGVTGLTTGASNYPIDIAVQGDYAFIVDQNSNELKVMDISNKTLPVQVGLLSFGGVSSPRRIRIQGNYAFVTDWDFDNLRVIDINNPAQPVVAGSVSIGPLPEEVAVAGNYAYITELQEDSLHIVRISTPSSIGVDINGEIVSIAASENDTLSGSDLQQLSLTGSELSITKGNTVNLDQVGLWKANGNDLYNLNAGNIGVGTNTPIILGNDKVMELKSTGLDFGSILQLSNIDRSQFLRFFSGRSGDPVAQIMFSELADLTLVSNENGYRELLRLTKTGNLGIETGPDAQLQLSMGDSDTGIQQEGDGELAFYSDFQEVFRITGTNRMGIGTALPEKKLHVAGMVKADSLMGDGSQITGIPFPDDSNTNEIQTLSVNGTDLTISGGNTVTIPVNAGGSGSWGVNGDAIYNINAGNVGVKVSSALTGFHVGADQRVLFGADTTGAGSRLVWFPAKGAFRAGTLEDFGVEGTYFDPDSIGAYSFAAGYNVLASGSNSVAMGENNLATGDIGATALGSLNRATGFIGATAFGDSNEASGNFGATALGASNFATGNSGALAMGYQTASEGNFGSTAIGYGSYVSGNDGATAMGYYTFASGNEGATALGSGSSATGFRGATGLGNNSSASGNFGAIALGYGSQAQGNYGSVAIGDNAQSTGHNGATAIGRNTVASSYSMVALGINNDTLGGYSKNTWVETDPILMVGHGSGSGFSPRETAMTILKNGNIGIGTMEPDQLLTLTALQTPVLRFERTGNQGFFDWELLATEGKFAFMGGANGTGGDLIEYVTFENNGRVKIKDLESGTTRMVTADSEGRLGTLAIPGGTGNLVSPWLDSGNDIYFDAGKVAIGTSSPEADLSVRGNVAIGNDYASGGQAVVVPQNGLMIQGNLGVGNHKFAGSKTASQPLTIIADDEPVMRLERGSTKHDWEVYAKTVFSDPDAGPGGRFSIRGGVDGTGSALPDRLTIADDGKVGIGTNNPISKLDVFGNIYMSNNSPGIGIKGNQFFRLGFGDPAAPSAFSEAFRMANNRQIKLTSLIVGDGSSLSHFGLHVEARDQGVIIELAGDEPDQTKSYITFAGGTQTSWFQNGRVSGQTLSDYQNSFEFAWYNTMAALDEALVLAEGIACAGQADVFEVAVMAFEGAKVYAEWVEWFINSQSNTGVAYESGSGDYAEWLPKSDPIQAFRTGEVVGIKAGEVSRSTKEADHIMVVSKSPIVLGNMPPEGEDPSGYEKIAFLGQVRTWVAGDVQKGDYILASGNHDGMGIARHPEEMALKDYRRIVGVAWTASEGKAPLSLINVAVGVNSNDVSLHLEKQAKEIEKLEEKVTGLEQKLDQILSHLQGQTEEVPGVTQIVAKEKQEAIEPSVVEKSIASLNRPASLEDISDSDLREVLSGHEAIFKARFDELKQYYQEYNINIDQFPEIKRIYDDPIQAIIEMKNGELAPTLMQSRKRSQRKVNYKN